MEGIRPDPPRNPKPRTVTATRVLRDALPHLHQLRGDPREASPQRGAAQRPEPPRASPLPGHLRPQRCALRWRSWEPWGGQRALGGRGRWWVAASSGQERASGHHLFIVGVRFLAAACTIFEGCGVQG